MSLHTGRGIQCVFQQVPRIESDDRLLNLDHREDKQSVVRVGLSDRGLFAYKLIWSSQAEI
jgi:hypothetical protein